MERISLYRFSNTVGINASGPTVYITASDALHMARQLKTIAKSIASEKFTDSQCVTMTIPAFPDSASAAQLKEHKSGRMLPATAAHILQHLGLADKPDFHSLRFSMQDHLHNLARAYGYRRPRNANGSTAREFYTYLCKRAKA